MKSVTAVEWLMEEMSKTYIFNQDDFDMFKQAKEIEKEQIITTHFDAQPFNSTMLHNAELYYSKKFNKII